MSPTGAKLFNNDVGEWDSARRHAVAATSSARMRENSLREPYSELSELVLTFPYPAAS